jgi:hypothetical protein
MSSKEIQRRKIARYVMLEAWKLKRSTILYRMTFSSSLKLSWQIIRGRIRKHYTKVVGVMFVGRQTLLKRLLHYPKHQVIIKFVRQPDNPYDKFAVLVTAEIKGRRQATLGYLSTQLAQIIAPLMDTGRQVIVSSFDVTGSKNKSYGCNLTYFLA